MESKEKDCSQLLSNFSIPSQVCLEEKQIPATVVKGEYTARRVTKECELERNKNRKKIKRKLINAGETTEGEEGKTEEEDK